MSTESPPPDLDMDQPAPLSPLPLGLDADVDAVAVLASTEPIKEQQSEEQQQDPKYGGFTRFEIELEFVQSLASPAYLLHLATSSTPSTTPPTPLLQHPPFITYLAYLAYWAQPPYTKFLMYPGPTLKNLELLQQERFRLEILNPEVVAKLGEEGVRATVGRLGGVQS